jgi:hypothetical protein
MKWAVTFFIIVITVSCKRNDSKYPYAIKDFSKKLQPHLSRIVSNGLIGVDWHSEMFVEDSISFIELNKLSYCEHPLLRAVAIRGLLKRDSSRQNGIIIPHLDDTAFIVVEVSNWRASFTGIDFSSISDDMIDHSTWKSFADRQRAIDEVILNHNKLNAAYTILDKIDIQERYYKSIREMIQRDRDHHLLFNTIVALSEYRKKEDVPIIKNVIDTYNHELKFPDSVLKMRDTIFYNYMDSLRVHIKSRSHFTNGDNIDWESFEEVQSKN